jgi:hypothetical protein
MTMLASAQSRSSTPDEQVRAVESWWLSVAVWLRVYFKTLPRSTLNRQSFFSPFLNSQPSTLNPLFFSLSSTLEAGFGQVDVTLDSAQDFVVDRLVVS